MFHNDTFHTEKYDHHRSQSWPSQSSLAQLKSKPRPYSLIAIHPPDLVPQSPPKNMRKHLRSAAFFGIAMLLGAGLSLAAFTWLWPKPEAVSVDNAFHSIDAARALAAEGVPPRPPVFALSVNPPKPSVTTPEQQTVSVEPRHQVDPSAIATRRAKPKRSKAQRPVTVQYDDKATVQVSHSEETFSEDVPPALEKETGAESPAAAAPGQASAGAADPIEVKGSGAPGTVSQAPFLSQNDAVLTGAFPSKGSFRISNDPMGGDELDQLLSSAQEPPEKVAPPRDESAQSAEPELPITPDQNQIDSALSSVSPIVKRCGDGSGGQIRLKLAVAGATGRVIDAHPTENDAHAGTPVGICAARQARLAKLPKFKSEIFVIEHLFGI